MNSSNRSDNAQSRCSNEIAPPAYDTISLAPPGADEVDPSSTSTRKKTLKEKWQDLKDEDEKRRTDRVQHVTREEADRITGLDKHKELEEKKSAERKRGKGTILGAIFLS